MMISFEKKRLFLLKDKFAVLNKSITFALPFLTNINLYRYETYFSTIATQTP